jgi:hypothetical protein
MRASWILAAVLLGGCVPDNCPHHDLEVRAFSGPDVTINSMSCVGAGDNWCDYFSPRLTHVGTHSTCDGLWLVLAENTGGTLSLYLNWNSDAGITSARAQGAQGCDNSSGFFGSSCSTTYTDTTAGWVMPEELGPVYRGAYSFTLGSGASAETITGTYDTSPTATMIDGGIAENWPTK